MNSAVALPGILGISPGLAIFRFTTKQKRSVSNANQLRALKKLSLNMPALQFHGPGTKGECGWLESRIACDSWNRCIVGSQTDDTESYFCPCRPCPHGVLPYGRQCPKPYYWVLKGSRGLTIRGPWKHRVILQLAPRTLRSRHGRCSGTRGVQALPGSCGFRLRFSEVFRFVLGRQALGLWFGV